MYSDYVRDLIWSDHKLSKHTKMKANLCKRQIIICINVLILLINFKYYEYLWVLLLFQCRVSRRLSQCSVLSRQTHSLRTLLRSSEDTSPCLLGRPAFHLYLAAEHQTECLTQRVHFHKSAVHFQKWNQL